MDLNSIRIKAHFDYIISRMTDKKKKEQFAKAMNDLANNTLQTDKPFNEGEKLALDIYNEIVQIHTERFVEGRSGDAYMEKL